MCLNTVWMFKQPNTLIRLANEDILTKAIVDELSRIDEGFRNAVNPIVCF